MNSFFCTMFAFLSLAGCSVANNIKGNTYVLVEPKYTPEITLGFDKTANRYYGKIVNNYFGFYKLNGSTINFEGPASTMMMGPEEDMKAESVYLKALEGEKTAQIKDDKLIIKDNKTTFTFKKK